MSEISPNEAKGEDFDSLLQLVGGPQAKLHDVALRLRVGHIFVDGRSLADPEAWPLVRRAQATSGGLKS